MNCIILKCNHIDVVPGSRGRIVGEKEGGYAVEITGTFTITGPTPKKKQGTETVWCEKHDVEIVP